MTLIVIILLAALLLSRKVGKNPGYIVDLTPVVQLEIWGIAIMLIVVVVIVKNIFHI